MKKTHLLIITIALASKVAAQNVGIGTATPTAKLHIKGAADTTQLLIDANSTQSNTKPMIKLRNSSGIELIRIHSDDTSNIFIGRNAGRVNDAAGGENFNTFIGSNTGYSNTTGGINTANGAYALYSNTTGHENTANGSYALFVNTTGTRNSADGAYALLSNTTGHQNTAIGTFALRFNTRGNYNVAVGSQALSSNDTGFQNTAIGASALSNNFYGYQNTAIGYQALSSSFTGYNNTAIGQSALSHIGGGFNNIAIGFESGTHPNTPNVYNTVGIGNDDLLNGFQDQVIIGNTRTWFIGGKVNWGTVSDARIKNNIIEDVKGLDFILRLRPVTYYISNKAIIAITGNKETPDYPGKYDGEKIKYSGFIAQEVEKAAKASGYEFSGYDAPKNEHGLYTIKYAEFVVPLVKAVQELAEQTIAQKKIIEQQQLQYETLLKRIEALEKMN
jgi:trimeric autotransporter adhesin